MTREEVIKQLESLYDHCEDMRSGDNDFAVWERDCEAIKIALSALRPVSREQVEKVWRGEWTHPHWSNDVSCADCKRCGKEAYHQLYHGVQDYYNFCPHCGAPMTDEAVDITMKRLEAMKDGE